MTATTCERSVEEELTAEAIRRAESAGYFPACAQRAVNWEQVRQWAVRVRQPGFRWATPDDRETDAIIVSPGPNGVLAVHAGQHRILGGLLGGNPVPSDCMICLNIFDRTRGWQEEATLLDLLELLGQ